MIHLCLSACSAVGRSPGFGLTSARMNAFASSEMFFQYLSWLRTQVRIESERVRMPLVRASCLTYNSSLPARHSSINCCGSLDRNGMYPQSRV